MQILFTISILCFLGILWAALALARHIKASQAQSLSAVPGQTDFKHHLLSITPASPSAILTTAVQAEPIRIVSPSLESLSTVTPQAAPQIQRVEQTRDTLITSLPGRPPTPAVHRARLNELNQSVHDIAANKQWILPPHPIRTVGLSLQRVGRPRKLSESGRPLLTTRKPPQPASRTGVVHRLDPAYFNKDLGDLTDPYQPQTRLRANDRRRTD